MARCPLLCICARAITLFSARMGLPRTHISSAGEGELTSRAAATPTVAGQSSTGNHRGSRARRPFIHSLSVSLPATFLSWRYLLAAEMMTPVRTSSASRFGVVGFFCFCGSAWLLPRLFAYLDRVPCPCALHFLVTSIPLETKLVVRFTSIQCRIPPPPPIRLVWC